MKEYCVFYYRPSNNHSGWLTIHFEEIRTADDVERLITKVRGDLEEPMLVITGYNLLVG